MHIPRIRAALCAALATIAVTAPTASAAQVSPTFAMGAVFDPHAPRSHSALSVRALPRSLPAAVSLQQFVVEPGDQGKVNACVSWAIAHSATGLLAREQGLAGGPNAPMYIYSQLVHGVNAPTSPSDSLEIAQQQGTDTQSHYSHGNYDYTAQPTPADRANAAHYRLSGYSTLDTGPALRSEVSRSLAGGLPVIMLFPVFQSFQQLHGDAASDYSYRPGRLDTYLGNHEVTIVGYNDKGVQIENSWSSRWGDNGFANLSWSYLQSSVIEAISIGKLVR